MRLHLIVSGIVQGVGFRYFAKSSAEQLGLGGFAKNLPTGDVEIEVEGEQAAVAAFITHIERGPARSKVTSIDSSELPELGETTFRIERS
jgi:acylphosphatase